MIVQLWVLNPKRTLLWIQCLTVFTIHSFSNEQHDRNSAPISCKIFAACKSSEPVEATRFTRRSLHSRREISPRQSTKKDAVAFLKLKPTSGTARKHQCWVEWPRWTDAPVAQPGPSLEGDTEERAPAAPSCSGSYRGAAVLCIHRRALPNQANKHSWPVRELPFRILGKPWESLVKRTVSTEVHGNGFFSYLLILLVVIHCTYEKGK